MKVIWIKIPERPRSSQGKYKNKYQERVAKWALQQFSSPWTGNLSVQIFYILNSKHGSNPDLDNLDKLLLDALKGIAYLDDQQIIKKISEFHYCGERCVTAAPIVPPSNALQKTAELQKQECTFVGITKGQI